VLSGEKTLVNGLSNGDGMRRDESAWRKAKLGQESMDKGLMIAQWESSIGGCHACRARRGSR
jgi:hypothetical protein